jgi:DNA-binding MarR family transcriptional regulator
MKDHWEDFALDKSLGFVLHRTLTAIKAMVRKEFRDRGFNVTIDQWVILGALWVEDGQTQVRLAERTFKDRPTVSRMIDLLEKQGLVVRRPSPQDRRAQEIFLTPKAHRLRDRLIPLVIELNRLIMKGFSDKEVNQLFTMLDRIFINTK